MTPESLSFSYTVRFQKACWSMLVAFFQSATLRTAGFTAIDIGKMIVPLSFVGQTLSELGFDAKGKWKVAVLLLLRKQEGTIAPANTEIVKPEDALVVSGTWDSLEELMDKLPKSKTDQ